MASGSAPRTQRLGDLLPNGFRSGRRPSGHSQGGAPLRNGGPPLPGPGWLSIQRGDRCPVGIFSHGLRIGRGPSRPMPRGWALSGTNYGTLRADPPGRSKKRHDPTDEGGLLPLLCPSHPCGGSIPLPSGGVLLAQGTRNPIAEAAWPLGRSLLRLLGVEAPCIIRRTFWRLAQKNIPLPPPRTPRTIRREIRSPWSSCPTPPHPYQTNLAPSSPRPRPKQFPGNCAQSDSAAKPSQCPSTSRRTSWRRNSQKVPSRAGH